MLKGNCPSGFHGAVATICVASSDDELDVASSKIAFNSFNSFSVAVFHSFSTADRFGNRNSDSSFASYFLLPGVGASIARYFRIIYSSEYYSIHFIKMLLFYSNHSSSFISAYHYFISDCNTIDFLIIPVQ